MAKASRWLKIFEDFTKDVRIKSKNVTSQDERGVPLVLYDSQKRYMKELAIGLDMGIHIFYCLKSRQLGITTISLLLDVFWLATHRHLDAALVTENEQNRDKNRAMLRHYIESFPPGYFGDDFYIKKGTDNIKSMGFSNGSSLRFIVAGTKKKSIAWGEGSGYAMAHLTEIASFYGDEGLASFEESFSQNNPDRLYIYESTAKGFSNVWHTRWKQAEDDPYTRRAFFIGWWATPENSIARSDPRFVNYGKLPRTRDERETLEKVEKYYDYQITPEQICWYRWRRATAQGQEKELFYQNQPSTAEEAFVESGYSFFQIRKINKVLTEIIDEHPEEHLYQCYRYDYGDSLFDMKMRFIDPDKHTAKEMETLPELRVWEEPTEEGRYVIGMDPSYADGHGDFSVISVWRVYADVMEQVAEYATNKVEPVRTAWVLCHLAGVYRDCIINLELQGGGTNVMQELESLKGRLRTEFYDQHPRSKDWEDAMGWARWYLYHRPDSMGKGYLYNSKTHHDYKHTMMYGFSGAFSTNTLVIHSVRLLYDMQNVRVEGNAIAAPESTSEDCKDDRVIAAALACKAWTDWRKTEMIVMGLTREIARKHADGSIPKVAQRMNNLVYRFMQASDLAAQEAAMNPVPSWREERHL